MLSSVRSAAVWAVLVGPIFIGCGGKPSGIERRVSADQLDALTRMTVRDGRRVCEATGYDPCPLRRAVANWLNAEQYALWESGGLVRIYGGRDSLGRDVGKPGQGDGSYGFATAVGPDRGGVAVIDGGRNTLVRFDGHGRAAGEVQLAQRGVVGAPGFEGAVPVLQEVGPGSMGDTAIFDVRVLKSPTDTVGTRVLHVPLPWLRLSGDKPVTPTPLFPAVPRYAVDADRSVVWSPGDRFEIQRRRRGGGVAWTLVSNRLGPAVTPEDIASRRHEIEDQADPKEVPPADIDSMIAHTGKLHPAIGGITIAPNGTILLAGPVTPSRDSVEYFVLTRSGVPTTRFTLPARMEVLLFAGDSLLVHRPTESEPWEVRWLQLKPASAVRRE